MMTAGSVNLSLVGWQALPPAMGVNRITPTETAAREMLRQFVIAR
jgi:hypothetical protein